MRVVMVKGLKRTSANLNIGGTVTESAANTYTEEEVSLPLSSLDREVFVVVAAWVDSGEPSMIPGTQHENDDADH